MKRPFQDYVIRRNLSCAVATAMLLCVPVSTSAQTSPPGNPVASPAAQWDYIVITDSAFQSDWQPLVDWKTRRGLKVVPLERIYATWATIPDDHAKIQAFIDHARQTWGTRFILLGGDSTTIPPCPGIPLTSIIDNDTGYGDLDDDGDYDVFVGRASVRNSRHIAVFIDKTLSYELDPPRTGYATTAAFLAFDMLDPGDGLAEVVKEDIDSLYLPTTVTLVTEYDSEPGSHKDDAIGYLNAGAHLVNHIDGGSWNSIGVGALNHGDVLMNWEIAGLTNHPRLSIVYSASSLSCRFKREPCVGEDFMRNPSGGAVAYIGYSGPSTFHDSTLLGACGFDRHFFRLLFQNDITCLGELFARHKEAYNQEPYGWHHLTLLGDPALPIWTDDPGDLFVSYPATIPPGVPSTFAVCVSPSGSSSPSDATVCLWKDGDFHVVKSPATSGLAVFNITPASTGELQVTVTVENCIPHTGHSMVE